MRIVVYPDTLKYRSPFQREARDVQDQPTGGTSEPRDGWQPRQIATPKYLGAALALYARTNRGQADQAPTEAEGGPTWRKPIVWKPLDQLLYGFGGFRAEVPESAPDQAGLEGLKPWRAQKLPNGYVPRPQLYQQNTPQDIDAPTEAEGANGWQPKPLRTYGVYNPIWKYLQNTGELTAEGGAGGQFQVFWEYRTRYEDSVVRFQRFLQGTADTRSGGPNLDENPLSWAPKPLAQFQLPKRVPYSYWFTAPEAGSAPVEAATQLSWLPKPLVRFVLPDGVRFYYFSDVSAQFSVPVTTTTVGRITGLEHRPAHWPTVIR